MKELGVVSWKLPPREMSCQHFHEIFAQRKQPRLQYIWLERGSQLYRRRCPTENKLVGK